LAIPQRAAQTHEKKSDTEIINSDSNRPPLNAINDNNRVSKDPEYSPPLSNQHSDENGSDGSPSKESSSPILEIPAHLESLKNKQISQRLQAFGEIPGPILPANLQKYLRHLARIEADPALVKLCQNRPDYTPELRAAMKGKVIFDTLQHLEDEMVAAF